MNRRNVPNVVGKQIPTSAQRNRRNSPTKNPTSNLQVRSRIQGSNQSPSQINRTKSSARPPPSQQQKQTLVSRNTNKNTNINANKNTNLDANKNINLNSNKNSNLNSNKNGNTNAIPAISREYDQMRQRLQELKELLAQLEAKWSGIIKQKESQHESIKNQLIKQHDTKMKQLEQSFTQTTSSSRNMAMKSQVDEMKKRAEALRNDGKQSEADALIRQAKDVESQMIDGERYTKIRELEARKQPLIKAHQIKMQQLKEQQESEINKLKKDENIEIDPVKAEIEKLEKRIHGDAAKAARSKLCLKE
ncbi:hypothetical protein M9Y10_000092 [Tritrichomonas musculus]|uniref:Lebercilin domain-containing protein n=1 Tax=Tritrichomonas musculus TaxID=1915356 RepID=A0ABR2L3D0_9EUKA